MSRSFCLNVQSAALAVAISIGSVIVIIYGLVGSSGSNLVTGGFYVLPSAVMLLAGSANRSFKFSILDALFICFALGIAASFALNQNHSNARDIVLLILCVFLGYIGGRAINSCNIQSVVRWTYVISAGIVLVGTIATIHELIVSKELFRPLVFGFGHATTVFSATLGYFTIVFVNKSGAKWRTSDTLTILFIAISAATYAAALVRWTLIATLIVLAANFIVTRRMRTAVAAIVFMVSVAGGALIRPAQLEVMLHYTLSTIGYTRVTSQTVAGIDTTPRYSEERISAEKNLSPIAHAESVPDSTKADTAAKSSNSLPPQSPESSATIVPPAISAVVSTNKLLPSCVLAVNVRNSIAIRKALYLDALTVLPTSGLFGIGLNAFPRLGCLPTYEIHNIFVQTAVEFGWIPGLILLLLTLAPIWILAPFLKSDANLRSILSVYVLIILVDSFHGMINSELAFFSLLGSVIGIAGSYKISDQTKLIPAGSPSDDLALSLRQPT